MNTQWIALIISLLDLVISIITDIKQDKKQEYR